MPETMISGQTVEVDEEGFLPNPDAVESGHGGRDRARRTASTR